MSPTCHLQQPSLVSSSSPASCGFRAQSHGIAILASPMRSTYTPVDQSEVMAMKQAIALL